MPDGLNTRVSKIEEALKPPKDYDEEETMPDADTRKHRRKTITLSTVVSVLAICGVILPVGGVVLSPWLVGVMSRAMAGEIKSQVQEQTMPLANGFKVLLKGDVWKLQDEVDELEFLQEDPRTRTALNAKKLANKRRELEDKKAALKAIEDSEKPSGRGMTK